jgi:hypothetical protein
MVARAVNQMRGLGPFSTLGAKVSKLAPLFDTILHLLAISRSQILQ